MRVEIMTLKEYVEKRIRGWLPKEPTLPSHQRMVKEARKSRRVNWVAVKIILVLLGFCWGWSAASYAFMYFIGNGVASDYATGYSIILWLAVFGAFGLFAFKVKRKKAGY
jgi:hypothetical protein